MVALADNYQKRTLSAAVSELLEVAILHWVRVDHVVEVVVAHGLLVSLSASLVRQVTQLLTPLRRPVQCVASKVCASARETTRVRVSEYLAKHVCGSARGRLMLFVCWRFSYFLLLTFEDPPVPWLYGYPPAAAHTPILPWLLDCDELSRLCYRVGGVEVMLNEQSYTEEET